MTPERALKQHKEGHVHAPPPPSGLISNISPDKLEPHPLNLKIYANNGEIPAVPELVESIRKYGILVPLLLCGVPGTEKRLIVSGHQRWLAAKQLGWTKVPASHIKGSSPHDSLAIELLLIESNRQRVKTPEQITREFTELKRIETELAKQRMLRGKEVNPRANLPQGSTGKARDKAAAKLGKGTRTLEKMEQVVREADEGSPQARAAVDAVNRGEQSVDRAYREVIVKPKQDPTAISQQESSARELQQFLKTSNVDGEVMRSKQPDKFHVTFRNVTGEQIRTLAKVLA